MAARSGSGNTAPITPPALSRDELRRFCDFLQRRTGMLFGESKRYYIDRRVAERIAAIGARSFAEYFPRLQSDNAEIERLINSFTVNETYFYREEHQLRCLGNSLLGPSSKGAGRAISCGSGPFRARPARSRIRLRSGFSKTGGGWMSTISRSSVRISTRAYWGSAVGTLWRACRGAPPEGCAGPLLRTGRGREWRLIEDLRELVTFTNANLVDARSMAAQGPFDVIFCRNVLIYFDEKSRLEAVHNMYESLNPGGFICLGHSESMARITDRFQVCRFADAIVYRKPEA